MKPPSVELPPRKVPFVAKKPAQKKPKPKLRKPTIHPIFVTLTQRHTINGIAYGPGTIKVRSDLAASLLEQETRAAQTESNFHNKRAFIVGRGGRRIEVPYDEFDAHHGQGNIIAGTFGG